MFYYILSGALMMACFVVGLFFTKFYKRTHDKLFLYFSYAFFLLSIERLLLGLFGSAQEPRPQIYLIRLGAFVLIILGIINKNRAQSDHQ